MLSESFPLLGVTVHLASLGRPLTLCRSLDLLWRSYSSVFLPLMSAAIRTSVCVCVCVWGELSVTVYILHRHRLCLVDRVDLTCSLYSWWEGLGSSLVTLPLDFNCGFISTSAFGSCTEVCS